MAWATRGIAIGIGPLSPCFLHMQAGPSAVHIPYSGTCMKRQLASTAGPANGPALEWAAPPLLHIYISAMAPALTLTLPQLSGPKPTSYTDGKAPMEPATQKLLAEFYAPFNKELSGLTGNPRFEAEWTKPE